MSLKDGQLGLCLAGATMLGDGLGLPHAKTQAVLLSNTAGFAVPERLAPLADIVGGRQRWGLLHDVNPRSIDEAAVRTLLEATWRGDRPTGRPAPRAALPRSSASVYQDRNQKAPALVGRPRKRGYRT